MSRFIFAFCFCFFLATADAAGPQIPKLTRPVVDEVGIFSSAQTGAIERLLHRLDQSKKVQMAVYVPKSLQGYDVESFSIDVVEKWQLGDQKNDQGLLLLIAPTERRMRLEVGYGLEGAITDAESKRAIDAMTPYFKKGRFADGVMIAIEFVGQKLGVDLNAPVKARITRKNRGSGTAFIYILMLFLVFGVRFLLPLLLGSAFVGRNRYGGGGGFGGGGGGFGGGGGGFGGGGASGSW